MLLLASTSDELRLVTREAANIDVQSTWADLAAGAVTPGRTNALVTTATTTTVVASPGVSTIRTVKRLTCRNRSATSACFVTVIHRASGPVDAELLACVIPPSGSLHYDEHRGFSVRRQFGVPERVRVDTFATPAVGALYTHVLREDVAVNSANVAARHQDVKELGFPVMEGNRYWFEFQLAFTAALATTGTRFNIYGPGTVTAMRIRQDQPISTTAQQNLEGLSSYDASGATSNSAATGSNLATLEGHVDVPTCDGMIYLRAGTEIANSTITIKAGSLVRWQRTT